MYYKPFKFSKFYLKHHFPNMDIDEYVDKFYYAERYYNQTQLDYLYHENNKYGEIKAFLNQKCLVYPTVFMTLHNLFNLHYVFFDEKIAINYHVKTQCPSQTPFEPSKLQTLTSKLLKYEGWEILDLSEAQFSDWYTQQKVDEVKGWLKEAKQRQVDKGLIDAEWKPPI